MHEKLEAISKVMGLAEILLQQVNQKRNSLKAGSNTSAQAGDLKSDLNVSAMVSPVTPDDDVRKTLNAVKHLFSTRRLGGLRSFSP